MKIFKNLQKWERTPANGLKELRFYHKNPFNEN